jgi:imidazole glycerol-phosphate synthase subunit HisH
MTERIAIIDYGSGNLRSAARAFARVVADHGLDREIAVTDDPGAIAAADRIVLPGQGAFGDCMAGLRARGDLLEILTRRVAGEGVPFLGICVGMQLMLETGYEHGAHAGLGWLPGRVARMTPGDRTLKIPHMGWNTLRSVADHPALRHIRADDHFYFVHSFVVESKEDRQIYALADHGGGFPAIIGRDNMIGTQFHVEKSHEAGLRLIRGFLEWKPDHAPESKKP